MDKIFLVSFDIEIHRYMGSKTFERNILRLVKAEDEESAKKKVIEKYEYFGHGDDSKTVYINDVSSCIE